VIDNARREQLTSVFASMERGLEAQVDGDCIGIVMDDNSLIARRYKASLRAFFTLQAWIAIGIDERSNTMPALTSSRLTRPGIASDKKGKVMQGSFGKSSRMHRRNECVNEPKVETSFMDWRP
jgi:hypothetical protein